MREQLKPCPFCGSPAEINVPGWVYADRPQFWRGVRCSQPPCPGAYIACGATEDSEEEAIAKITAEWNTRHADLATEAPPAAPSIQPKSESASAPSATSPAREWWAVKIRGEMCISCGLSETMEGAHSKFKHGHADNHAGAEIVALREVQP